jgi:hypothetical protein
MELDLEGRCVFEKRLNQHLAICNDKGHCIYTHYFLNLKYCRRYHDRQYEKERLKEKPTITININYNQ